MAEKIICDAEDLVAIADAVRASNGSTETYNVPELSAAAVSAIGNGGGAVETCTVVTNVTNESNQQVVWYFTIVENGNVTWETVYETGEQTHVVCGSPVIAVLADEHELGGASGIITSVETTAGYHDVLSVEGDAAVFILDGVEAGETVAITLTVTRPRGNII